MKNDFFALIFFVNNHGSSSNFAVGTPGPHSRLLVPTEDASDPASGRHYQGRCHPRVPELRPVEGGTGGGPGYDPSRILVHTSRMAPAGWSAAGQWETRPWRLAESSLSPTSALPSRDAPGVTRMLEHAEASPVRVASRSHVCMRASAPPITNAQEDRARWRGGAGLAQQSQPVVEWQCGVAGSADRHLCQDGAPFGRPCSLFGGGA